MNKKMNMQDSPMQPVTTFSEIFRYGFGGATLNIIYFVYASYVIFFWTDYALVPAAAAGVIYSLGRVFCAITDPIAGIISDRTNTRFGKYRPYLMVTTPVVVILFFLLFTNFEISATAKVALYSIIYIVFCINYELQTVTYEAQVPSMSSDLSKRNFVVMSRQVLGTGFGYSAMALVPIFLKAFGDDEKGWHITIGIFAAAAFLCMLLSLSGSKKHDLPMPRQDKKQEKGYLKEDLKKVLTTKPLLLLIASFGCVILAFEVISATNIYVFKYAVGNEAAFSVVSFATLPAAIAGAFLTPFLVAKFGKKQIFILAGIMSLIKPMIFLLFDPFDSMTVLIILYMIQQYFQVTMIVTVWTMVADCVEYVALTKNVYSAGLATSCNTFMLNFGGIVAGLAVGGLLTLAGYTGADMASSATINGIIWINAGIPGAAFLIACIVLKFYTVNNRILQELGANIGKQVVK
ncbi:glycoside-pentoside-hexuronide (GPH):cation symporter [Ihubacter massiliensis]|uniref:Glycoside-pentoside-hexuronide (GPH):cation symporter n=1 Tax=Hominibacterium faecale TaxID=2839743 RepID=A0A9J6QLD5_9FIRM|nr:MULTISPECIES: glycoside-pentoside-hexuronide (GPH):cation symporter [Eubacteriales Family XIII. Incertae Sedis]MCO7121053.1 glycoside-pentoside-hexuronide (GPH):cation symporter [Ihubacter massiliensis]MCU7377969.1 glycoside-pentoside-hexuronide (GPH):cation symporter [Hominibacterium faecale]